MTLPLLRPRAFIICPSVEPKARNPRVVRLKVGAGRAKSSILAHGVGTLEAEQGFAIVKSIYSKRKKVQTSEVSSGEAGFSGLPQEIMDLVLQSPVLHALMGTASERGWSVSLEDVGQDGYEVDGAAKMLRLDSRGLGVRSLTQEGYFRSALVLSLARGLREIWHEDRMGSVEARFRPESVLIAERFRAADVETIAVLAAWELRAAGSPDIWRHLIGSSEGDMALSFSRAADEMPSPQVGAAALVAAFRQWFRDESRTAACDHQALERMDAFQKRAETHAPFGTARLSGAVAEGIGCLPFGHSYLRGTAAALLGDPDVLGVNDPVNQAHLLHLIHDLQVVMAGNVPFRDAKLARMIFPEHSLTRV